MRRALEVFRVALRLGLTSFGGPAAHLGYFRTEYVERRHWVDDDTYAEIVAVAQFLPGPSSSQVGATIGYLRAGGPGAVAAWLGFTLPSAVAMAVFAAVASSTDVSGALWLAALKLVAVAVVLDAVIAMARTLTRTPLTLAVALAVGAASLLVAPTAALQVGCLLTAGLAGLLLAPRVPPGVRDPAPLLRLRRRTGALLLVAFAVLSAVVLTLAAVVSPASGPGGRLAGLASATYGAGALVFGGGHVVLPLLQSSTVPALLDQQTFLAGYGAAQALPGPLFAVAAYLGQVVAGPAGAALAVAAIFAPGMLLLFGVLPFWATVRGRPRVRAALVGVNAGVVGLLAAALVDPIGTSSVHGWVELLYAAALFALLRLARARPVLVVGVALLGCPLLGLA